MYQEAVRRRTWQKSVLESWASQVHVAVLLFPSLPSAGYCEAGGPCCARLLSTLVLWLPLLCLLLFQMCSTWQEPL